MTTRFRLYLLSTFSLLVLLLAAPPVFASGFLIYDQGAESMGKASAVVGGNTDPSAIFYNPAGISFGNGLGIETSGQITWLRNSKFEADDGSVTHGGNRYFLAGSTYIAAQVTDWMHLGFGLFAPFGGGVTWPKNWVGKTFETYDDMIFLYLNPTISFKITPRLSFAVGFQVVRGVIEITRATPDGFGEAKTGFQGWGYGGNLGIMYQLVPEKVSVGLSYRSRVKVPLGGKAHFVEPGELNNNFMDQGIHTSVTLPDIISLGVSFKPMDELQLGVDVLYIAWDTWDRFKVTFDKNTLPTQIQPSNYHGSMEFRVGGQYELEAGFLLRAGVAYEQSPAPKAFMASTLPDPNYVDFTIGLHIPGLVEWMSTDISYMLQWGLPTGSESGVVGPPGRYSRLVHVLALSSIIRFGYSTTPAPEPVVPPPPPPAPETMPSEAAPVD